MEEELPLREALLEEFGGKFEGGLDDCLDEVAVDTFLWFFLCSFARSCGLCIV